MSMHSSKLFIQFQQCFAALAIVALLVGSVPATAFAVDTTPPTEDTTSGGESGSTIESGDPVSDTTGGQASDGGDTTDSATDGANGTDGAGTGDTAGTDTGGDTTPADNGGTDGAAGTEGATGTNGGDTAGTGTDTGTDTTSDGADAGTGSTDGGESLNLAPDTGTDTTGGDESAQATDGGTEETSGDTTGTDGTTSGDATGTDTTGADTGTGTTDGTDGGDSTGTDTGATGTDGTTTGDITGTDGTEGTDGTDGQATAPGDEVDTPEDADPVTIISDNRIATDATPDDGQEVTGSQTVDGHRSKVTINTGEATAQAEITSDVNSGDIKSYVDTSTFFGDLDNYIFNASGTNEADVTNTAATLARTGDNVVTTIGGPADIFTGDAYAAINIANVVNSTVVNSDGFLYLGNRMLEPNQSLDLTDFFFPDPDGELARATDCDLLSCRAEDIYYNFSQTNTATVTNNAEIEAITGQNYAETPGSIPNIFTGEAYGGANVVNVVNTNIIDSNYRFMTLNAMGDLDGDILLPTEELFQAFYGRPNGMTQLETVEDSHVEISNTNNADVNNNLDAYAETGLNTATTSLDPYIKTGNAEAESNILSKVNQNIFGGDVMYLLIRVHGSWNGEVQGLPSGLDWMWTPSGILIFNEGAEIAPSTFLPYDVDSYNAAVTDFNEVTINNNISIDSITGMNESLGSYGTTMTGDAFASANLMNIANTNVIGANWTFAVINIFGDFKGDIAFSDVDLSMTGEVDAPNPLGPGDALTYTYTVHNNSTVPALNVVLDQTLTGATAPDGELTQQLSLGDLAPGASKTVELTATVDDPLNIGTTSVEAVAVVNSDEAELTPADNAVLLQLVAEYAEEASGNGEAGTTTDPTNDGDTATTTDPTDGDETASTTDQSTVEPEIITSTPSPKKSRGGGGGGDPKSTKVEREVEEVDPNAPPFLVVEKSANYDEDDVVKAGEDVDYTIKVTNKGGRAYDAVVYDKLESDIGAVISEDSWELGTIEAGEEIKLTYTTTYDFKTPSGVYTNTASLIAYREEDGKANGDDPLNIDEAEYDITIKGVPLAVGNMGILAVFPGTGGTVSALVAWETSKPALSQVFFGQKTAWSVFNEKAQNYGFPEKSFRFSTMKDHHLMIINGLTPGATYAYRIDAHNTEHSGLSSQQSFTVPGTVRSLALNTGSGFLSTEAILARVAGVSLSTPAPQTAPAYGTYVPPATPKPAVVPEPEPEPEPEPVAQESNNNGGFLGGVKDKVFGFFR